MAAIKKRSGRTASLRRISLRGSFHGRVSSHRSHSRINAVSSAPVYGRMSISIRLVGLLEDHADELTSYPYRLSIDDDRLVLPFRHRLQCGRFELARGARLDDAGAVDQAFRIDVEPQ